MASRTSRTSVLRGRPPGYTGMSGSIKAHCSSVTSLGYLWLRIPITYENTPLWDSHSAPLDESQLVVQLSKKRSSPVGWNAFGRRQRELPTEAMSLHMLLIRDGWVAVIHRSGCLPSEG